MQPVGKVTAVRGSTATVEMIRHSACSSCRACPMGHEDSSLLTIQAENPVSASLGQQVAIEFSPHSSLRAAALAYVWPLLALFVGYGVVNWFAAPRWPGSAEMISALGSIALCGLAFLSLRLLEPKLRKNRSFVPVIKEIIG